MFRRLSCLAVLVCLSSGVSAWSQELRTESFQGQEVVAGEILVRFRGASEVQSRSTLALDNNVSFAEPVGSTGAMRVRSSTQSVAALLLAYQSRLDVLYAEPNYVWRKSDLPNDALFAQQWSLRNTGQVIQGLTGVNGADIKANQAWDITEGSRSFVIGVIDSGVDYNHPDLAANIWSAPNAFTVTVGGQTLTCPAGSHGYNAILKTCDPMDDDTHGTHVAGIIGGAGNNGLGVSGVARVASIMGLKFLSPSGGGSTSDAIDAIDFAIKVKAIFPSAANVRILNASWGGFFNSAALRDQISLTQNTDMLFVAAAGNDALINDLIPQYPAGYDLPNILSVAASTNRDILASFSNWGPLTVNLAAPGDEILSTVPRGQFSRLGSELFSNPSQAGWIQASSPAVGLQSFWVGGDFTTFMDGAAAAPSARELVFPLVTGQTELNIANPGTGVTSVTFRVYGPLGTEIAGAVTQNVAANGIHSVRTSTLFPSLNLDGVTASIRVTGSANITGSSVTTDFPVAPSWTVINGIDASLSLLQVNFPHVPSGSQGGGPAWTSVLGITNISPEAQNVTLTFTPNSGAPVQVVRSIPGRGTVRLSVQTEFGFSSAYQEGWVRVSGPAPLNGFIAYGFAGSSGAAVVPSQGIAQSTLLFSHVANGPGWGTGLALLNSSGIDAEVRVYIMNPDGSLIGGADNVPTAAFTLPAGAKTARLLTELVPTANSNGGFVFVRTANNVPLFGLELFFTSDARVIANVSAGAVDPSITYTPPTP